MEKLNSRTAELMNARFGKDNLIALATTDGMFPAVRAVNAYYENGAFYVITDARSNKMSQLGQNPNAAICGDWFTAHGTGENLGWIDDPANAETARKLKRIFSEWYDNGHIDEENRNTVILRIRLMDGILFHHGERYEIDFSE
ncbi:MAG: pyridoxamine 5'-phosphate oxidase family protein [Clostridia bacterium]|nr:pyridoxamine 5'-phosphate oxidase family protein [Clostridia bacterium]MBQ8513460.1 pyridoxamine 5'-phosphate oxidase family protein [Clostridia bacterium]